MEETQVTKKITIKDLLPYKSYITLITANIISRFGDSLDSIAYSWMVYSLTGSKLLMGTIFAINAVPNIIFSPFAGTIVDRLKKKPIVVIGFLGRGIIVSLTALFLIIGILKPWHLFIFTFISSTLETFIAPAHSALIPLILPKELFLTASSISTSLSKFCELIGIGSAGVIIALFNTSGAIFIDGITFFIACLLIFFIKIKNDTKRFEQLTLKSYFIELKEGFLFIEKEKIILIVIILFAIINFCLAPFNIFMPVITKDILKGGPEILSMLGIALTIGTILGGIVVGQFGNYFKLSSLTTLGLIFLGVCYSLLYIPFNFLNVSSALVFTTVIFALIGFTIPIISSPICSLVMSKTPNKLMGRVSSVLSMIACCSIPLGSAVVGIISEYVPISLQFLIMGVIIVCASIRVYFYKDFRKV